MNNVDLLIDYFDVSHGSNMTVVSPETGKPIPGTAKIGMRVYEVKDADNIALEVICRMANTGFFKDESHMWQIKKSIADYIKRKPQIETKRVGFIPQIDSHYDRLTLADVSHLLGVPSFIQDDDNCKMVVDDILSSLKEDGLE